MEISDLNPRKIKGTKEEAILKIEKYAGEGVSIAYHNDKTVFVRYAIPGETVKVNIYKETTGYAVAEPLEILEPSPDRIEPFCPFFAFCGGCDYQMLDYERQIEIKTQLAMEAFERIGKMENPHLTDIIRSPQPFYYRNTETFKVKPHAQKVGFFRKDTKFIVDIDECKIAMPNINGALQSMKRQEQFPKHNFKVRTTLDGDTTVNWVESVDYEDRDLVETVTAGGFSFQFKISKDSFFQVNDYVIPLWLEKIISFLDESHSERIYDLYCGIGLITLFVAQFAKHTVGIEIAKSSVIDANHNKRMNHLGKEVEFIQGDVGEVLRELGPTDVIIVDPPRKGMDTASINLLLEMEPQKIIYSSCKPATLARDIHLLSEKYELKECVLVDMFPQTHHVEMVNLLVRKDG